MVHPLIIGTLRVKSRIRCQTDRRVLITKIRGSIIEMPLFVEKGNVRRPDIDQVRVDIMDPGRVSVKDTPTEFPIDLVLRANKRDATARREHIIGITLMSNDRIMRALDKSLRFE